MIGKLSRAGSAGEVAAATNAEEYRHGPHRLAKDGILDPNRLKLKPRLAPVA
jgi:hypothetical protein